LVSCVTRARQIGPPAHRVVAGLADDYFATIVTTLLATKQAPRG
jgi:hypothetical protein